MIWIDSIQFNQRAINKEVINLSLNSLALDISIDISQSRGKEEGGFKDSMMKWSHDDVNEEYDDAIDDGNDERLHQREDDVNEENDDDDDEFKMMRDDGNDNVTSRFKNINDGINEIMTSRW